MEATKECDPRIEAMKTVFQKKFDKLRTELKPDIKGFNSKLRSKGLITHEVWSKHDIDETLSAISGRLQNEDVTVRTFTEFSDAVSEISSHLKSMLSKALSKELKEEPVFSTPSYATPAISEHSQSADSFAGSPIGNFPGPTVPPANSFQPGTSWAKESDVMIDRRDSALSTSTATDGEIFLVSGGHAQATDQDENRPMTQFDSTIAVLERKFTVRLLELENVVSELQEEIKLLTMDRNIQALEFLQLEEDKTGGLRQKLESIKKEQFDIEQSLDQKTKKYEQKEEEHLKLYEQKKEKARIRLDEESRRLADEAANERVRLEKETANERVRLEKESADERVKLAEECADERVRLVKENADERVRLMKKSCDERVRLAEESADERARLLEKERKKSEQYREKIAAYEQFMNSSSLKELGKKIKEMDVELERNNR